ncbi:MAG: hypothetical protein IT330_04445 [Anaerolineae bacterium]|nr:hypothetical protein [Anaerolineae bacterium]
MYQSTYWTDKTTDTFADTLLMYGVAILLDHLLTNNVGKRTVRIKDEGSVFAITLERPIAPGFENVPWFCDLPFIETRSKKPPEGWLGVTVDYDAERERNTNYYAARKQLPPEARRPGATPDRFPALAQAEALKPRSDWQVLAQINQMGSIAAYTQVLEAWAECRTCFPDLLRLLLALFAATPNDTDAALTGWKALKKERGLNAKDTATPVQVLNPAMGKGINRAKADGADRLGNPDSFWPLEFLKFWGMRGAGLPRVVKSPQPTGGRGPRDRKTYVLHPVNISLETHQNVYDRFNEGLWANTAVKMDILAALRYTDTYLEQWLAGEPSDDWGGSIEDRIKSLAIAFYKDMGSAVSLLNLSEIGLPRWMQAKTSEQGHAYRDLLQEHLRIVSSLSERNADEYRLLTTYRSFLSGHDLIAFFGFTGAYSALLMSRLERGQWAPRFLTTNLEVLIMGHDHKLKPILDTPGFQHIATAIRRSTVTPQYFKSKGQSRVYDIRYGLGTDLLRKAAYPDRFIQALSEFMHAYNQENAQINERYDGKPPVRRSNITTDDIAQVVALIDEYGAQTVGNLLVAFGYARESREPEPGEAAPETTEEAEDSEA